MGKVTGRRHALGKLALIALTFATFTAPGFITDASALGHTVGKLGHTVGKLGHTVGKLGHTVGK